MQQLPEGSLVPILDVLVGSSNCRFGDINCTLRIFAFCLACGAPKSVHGDGGSQPKRETTLWTMRYYSKSKICAGQAWWVSARSIGRCFRKTRDAETGNICFGGSPGACKRRRKEISPNALGAGRKRSRGMPTY